MKLSTSTGALSVATVAAIVLLLGATAARAADAPGSDSVTVKGEIVDLACYLNHGARGAKHQQCALTCLKNGEPMGLLTESGQVYLLLADHQDAKPFEEAKTYAADQVEVTGPIAEKAGITGLTVLSVKKM
jgi:type 1 fimbria pilin